MPTLLTRRPARVVMLARLTQVTQRLIAPSFHPFLCNPIHDFEESIPTLASPRVDRLRPLRPLRPPDSRVPSFVRRRAIAAVVVTPASIKSNQVKSINRVCAFSDTTRHTFPYIQLHTINIRLQTTYTKQYKTYSRRNTPTSFLVAILRALCALLKRQTPSATLECSPGTEPNRTEPNRTGRTDGGDDTDVDTDTVDVVSARHRRGVVTSRREREREREDGGAASSGADARCRGWCANHRGSFERRVGGGGDDGDDDG